MHLQKNINKRLHIGVKHYTNTLISANEEPSFGWAKFHAYGGEISPKNPNFKIKENICVNNSEGVNTLLLKGVVTAISLSIKL